MKQIIVNVSGLSEEEKQRVNEALAKIKGIEKLSSVGADVAWLYAPSQYDENKISWNGERTFREVTATHTPQQVLEMAGMEKQGHVHADLMALYAEDAKTTDKPWELWEFKDLGGVWVACRRNPLWQPDTEYRRKPKTHIVHGVEVPDLRVVPKDGEEYYVPDPTIPQLHFSPYFAPYPNHSYRHNSGLCYEYTEEGRQAAILHAKAWLGIA